MIQAGSGPSSNFCSFAEQGLILMGLAICCSELRASGALVSVTRIDD